MTRRIMPSPMVDVAGRVVVVTGAGSGIGAASTRALLALGASVLAVDRRDEGLVEMRERVDAPDLEVLTADASSESGVESVMHMCRERFGALHGVVASAGISRHGAAHETPPSEWDEVIEANLRSVYLAAHFGVPLMRETGGGGALVAVASQIGLVGKRRAAAYCAAKGGVVNLVRAMALDYAAEGIRVNCVCPGPIRSPMLLESLAHEGDASLGLDALSSQVPAGRLGTPEEVASTIVFLLSAAASFVTGAAWTVDGGYVAA